MIEYILKTLRIKEQDLEHRQAKRRKKNKGNIVSHMSEYTFP